MTSQRSGVDFRAVLNASKRSDNPGSLSTNAAQSSPNRDHAASTIDVSWIASTTAASTLVLVTGVFSGIGGWGWRAMCRFSGLNDLGVANSLGLNRLGLLTHWREGQ